MASDPALEHLRSYAIDGERCGAQVVSLDQFGRKNASTSRIERIAKLLTQLTGHSR